MTDTHKSAEDAGAADPLQQLLEAYRYDEALQASEQILAERGKHDSKRMLEAQCAKGRALYYLNRYGEALALFEEAITEGHAAGNGHAVANALVGKGDALRGLIRDTEALAVFEEAITEGRAAGNGHAVANALEEKGDALRGLNRDTEALAVFAEAY